ncbi:MAG: hypothetical protein RBG13Loki_0226 [Promethearchaeota archaeon CR_4]|nr:MAG: hypothetical protein RBG13Loki_0226 [Candidatus Lokiarchaeota archaeon CR_4]
MSGACAPRTLFGLVDFNNAIVHFPAERMLCIGTFVGEAPYSNTFTWLKIFYHSTKEHMRDFLPTKHYFFRYDVG